MKIQKNSKLLKSVDGPTKKDLDRLWAEIVKLRWHNVSGISGKPGPLHSHHIVGKPNLRLRYELKNGIALTAGEHKFRIHHAGRSAKCLEEIKSAIGGEEVYQWLLSLRGPANAQTDLMAVKLYLQAEKRRLTDGN